jgi:hypothetical protein
MSCGLQRKRVYGGQRGRVSNGTDGRGEAGLIGGLLSEEREQTRHHGKWVRV